MMHARGCVLLLAALALARVEHGAAFFVPALASSRAVVGSPHTCSVTSASRSLNQARDSPFALATAATRKSTPRLYAESGAGGDAVDETYYSVAAIRGKQVVANAARGGMV